MIDSGQWHKWWNDPVAKKFKEMLKENTQEHFISLAKTDNFALTADRELRYMHHLQGRIEVLQEIVDLDWKDVEQIQKEKE